MRALRTAIPFVLAIALAAVAFAVTPATPVQANDDARAVVVKFARAQIGKPYKYATTGPATYDCTGLVIRTFKATGLGDLIGNKYRSARGTYTWFANQGLVTNNPKPGDLVAWGNPASHIGIYTGVKDGHPMTVSALTTGVKEHRVHSVTTKFRAYLRVPFDKADAGATGSTAPVSVAALPAPFKSTINLRKGSHTLYRLNGSGSVVEQRSVNRSTTLAAAVDPTTKSFGGQPYVQRKSGPWSGWWLRAPEATGSSRYRFPSTRTLRLSAGDHLFKTFLDGGKSVVRQHVRVTKTTTLKVNIRATFNGARHFLIADGPLAGTWVQKTAKSSLAP
jgi:uncharacterized protein YijF (DUF1287 family)